MIPAPTLDLLAARWADRPEPGVFAALAEGLAKRGDLAEAGRVVAAGLARYPGHAAGLIVQARIAVAAGDRELAKRALAVLLERDPAHPLARELAGEIVPALLGDEAAPQADSSAAPVPAAAVDAAVADQAVEASETIAVPFEEDAPAPDQEAAIEPRDPREAIQASDEESIGSHERDGDPDAPPIITESLAALYHRQGHLEEALAAYAELAARDPSNDTVAARHEAVRRELTTRRPLPFEADQSGGRPVAAWLGTIAAARPADRRDEASFDAFYQPPPSPPAETADFDAFQRWLEELAR